MTLRDVHDRCVTCGRPPGEDCCGTCHTVAARLRAEPLWAVGRTGNQIIRAQPKTVNTEAVNQ